MDVKCCRHQHEVLLKYIRYALQCWGPLDDLSLSYWINDTETPWMRSPPIQMTPELKQVLTRARILSEECCIEVHPLKALLQHANWSQEFLDIVKEIQWCTSVVYNSNICRNVTRRSSPELKIFPWQAKIGYQENLFLERAEQEDWQQLMQELVKYYEHHHCSPEDCGNMQAQMDTSYCLAIQAMQRHFTQETGGSEFDHKSMWSFNPEVVKHGRPLGSGSFGFVTEVMWLGSKYAHKIFNASGLHSFRIEAKALVKLNHPHIVKVYAYSKNSLLMDLMYTDLHKFMESRMEGGTRVQPFSLRAAMDLMLQIADAVNYIHSQKMAHRDLKSSNILLNPVNTLGLNEDDGFVFAKVADFGLAKVKRDITRYSHLTHNVGTRRWMAPEIFAANIEDDHLEHAFPMKADVYSFGILCFEILTGQVPFNDEPFSTLYSKLTAPIPLRPPLPSNCPLNLTSLIYECWDADPQKRPTFRDVCRVLRYFKGLPTLIAFNDAQSHPIDGEWPFGRLPAIVKKQVTCGAAGTPKGNKIVRSVGPVADIRGVEFIFSEPERKILSGFKILIDRLLPVTIQGGSGVQSSGLIVFEETEFLVQVEGSISPERGVYWLNFITTRQEYRSSSLDEIGRALQVNSKLFRSDRGRVVGFTGVFTPRGESWILRSLEVNTIPNIVGCLRQYLGNKE